MNRREKKKTKRIRRMRKKQPEYKLHLLWYKKANELGPRDLIRIVLRQDYPIPFRKRVLREFLKRINLNFDSFDRMLNVAKDILEADSSLKKQFYEQCFRVCTENNLVELGDSGDTEAIKELIRRVKQGSAKNTSGLKALVLFFDRATYPKTRMELWKIIKEFDPTEEDLIELYNMVYGKYGFQGIVDDIQKFLKKRKRKKTKRILIRIEELAAQIKQRQE